MSEQPHHPFGGSSLARRRDCPGSVEMEKLVAAQLPPPPESPEAAEGTMLHRAVATGDLSGLDDEHLALVEKCRKLIICNQSEWKTEVRLEWPFPGYPDRLTAGTVDALAVYHDGGVILDWKFGRLAVPDADENLQLMVYAGLALVNHPHLPYVDAATFNPRFQEAPRWVRYTTSDWLMAERAILGIRDRCEQEPWHLIPGESQCRHCPATAGCPACQTKALVPMQADAKALTAPERLADWVGMYQAAKGKGAKLYAAAVDLAKQGQLPGWRYVEKPGNREFTNEGEALRRLRPVIGVDAMLGCARWSIANLETAWVTHRANGVTVDQSKAEFAALLAGVTTRGVKGSIERLGNPEQLE